MIYYWEEQFFTVPLFHGDNMGKIYRETDRVMLREFCKNDLNEIFIMSHEEDYRKFLPDQYYPEIETAEKTLDFLISQYSETNKLANAFVLGIQEVSTGLLIGHVGLSPINSGIEVGYAVRDSHKNQAYATESVSLMLDIAFNDFMIQEVYGVVEQENKASVAVLEKCGFHLHGEKEKSLVYIAIA